MEKEVGSQSGRPPLGCFFTYKCASVAQVRDKQAIAHLKAQLAQAQAVKGSGKGREGVKGIANGISRKASAHMHMAMEKGLHMDRELDR